MKLTKILTWLHRYRHFPHIIRNEWELCLPRHFSPAHNEKDWEDYWILNSLNPCFPVTILSNLSFHCFSQSHCWCFDYKTFVLFIYNRTISCLTNPCHPCWRVQAWLVTGQMPAVSGKWKTMKQASGNKIGCRNKAMNCLYIKNDTLLHKAIVGLINQH